MSSFKNSVFSVLFLMVAFSLSSSCSKFSAREMYTGGDTNIGSSEPDPDNKNPGPDCATVTITWNKNTEADLAGYRIYYGLSPSSISGQVQLTDKSKTVYQFTKLTSNVTYYFEMTAYDLSGNESKRDPKNVVSKRLPLCSL